MCCLVLVVHFGSWSSEKEKKQAVHHLCNRKLKKEVNSKDSCEISTLRCCLVQKDTTTSRLHCICGLFWSFCACRCWYTYPRTPFFFGISNFQNQVCAGFSPSKSEKFSEHHFFSGCCWDSRWDVDGEYKSKIGYLGKYQPFGYGSRLSPPGKFIPASLGNHPQASLGQRHSRNFRRVEVKTCRKVSFHQSSQSPEMIPSPYNRS